MTNVLEIPADLTSLDAQLQLIPNAPGVFALWPAEGDPYLSKTALLRRRLLRLLRERKRPSRLLNLRHTARRIEYELTGSAFESSLVHYEEARRHFPETYRKLLKLRMPSYVKIVLSNQFPRSQIVTHLSRQPSTHFGPFRTRTSAERFEGQFLDLFQMRRCQEDLVPSPDHPGCIYGEMAMCLRPCQQVVGPQEYSAEVDRVVEFLRSDGNSLLETIEHSRDRLSEEMRFEEAARQHKRFEKVQEVLKLRDELARDLDRLHGVVIERSLVPEAVELWFVRQGHLLPRTRFSFQVQEGRTVSLDRKLHETIASLDAPEPTVRDRQEHLALLARWFYSSWRDGEWLPFESFDDLPYRKLVNAISRVARVPQP
jgi:excinuclease UvrABC nuclease subunit